MPIKSNRYSLHCRWEKKISPWRLLKGVLTNESRIAVSKGVSTPTKVVARVDRKALLRRDPPQHARTAPCQALAWKTACIIPELTCRTCARLTRFNAWQANGSLISGSRSGCWHFGLPSLGQGRLINRAPSQSPAPVQVQPRSFPLSRHDSLRLLPKGKVPDRARVSPGALICSARFR